MILAASALIEAVTGVVLLVDPVLVVAVLFGIDESGKRLPLGRIAGIALLALGVACWPGTDAAGDGMPALRAMLAYNALVAVYLAYLGLAAHLAGLLLWPAVAEHVVVTLLLIAAWRRTS